MSEVALPGRGESSLRGLGEREFQATLRAHNPKAQPTEIRAMAKIMSVVFDVVTGLPRSERRELARDQDEFRAAFEKVAHSLGSIETEAGAPVETIQGSGLGKVVSLDEGRGLLDRYASHVPMEDWAGPVAGAGEIEKRLGIARSTLGSWVQQKAVIGLLRGQRKLAYPIEQFVDARPVSGIADMLRLAPDARSAWLWLRQPHGALGGRLPLDLLRNGEKDHVVRIAERDFARETNQNTE
ncbi:MAG: hypothetical protein AB7V46_13990 [Thermomicrobiales bacterium]